MPKKLPPSNILASASNKRYIIYVSNVIGKNKIGTKLFRKYIYDKRTKKLITSGFWMDWPEKHWKISKKKYYQMTYSTRAELECEEQIKNWLKE